MLHSIKAKLAPLKERIAKYEKKIAECVNNLYNVDLPVK